MPEVGRLAREHHRTVVQTEVTVPGGTAFEDWCGGAFALRHGLRSVSTEDRLVLPLPFDPERLAGIEAGLHPLDEHRIVSFAGTCPDDLVEEWARMSTQMNEDVPTGELTRTPSVVDVDAVRAAGNTELLVSAHDHDFVLQDDTLIDRAHRGHGLGTRTKAANLRLLGSLEGDLGRRRWLQTHTEQGNVAMQRPVSAGSAVGPTCCRPGR